MSLYFESIQKIKNKQRNEIRRQYIETFTKNKRKLLMQERQKEFNQQQQMDKQQHYQKYLASLTFQTFIQEPNNHLQFLVEILSSSDTKLYRDKLADLLIIVHRYLIQNFTQERAKVEYLRDIVKQQKLIQDNQQFSDLLGTFVVDILVFNQVFFQPVHSARQKKFTPQKSSQSKSFNQQNNRDSLESVTSKKINLHLLLDFFIVLTYQITPEVFVNSLRQKNTHHITRMSNGYEQLLNDFIAKNIFSHNQIPTVNQSQFSNQTAEIALLVNIFHDIYNMTLSLYKISRNFRYHLSLLQKLQKGLLSIYNTSQNKFIKNGLTINQDTFNMNKTILPQLWFDKERMFIKESQRNFAGTRCLQIIVNMTSLTSMNPQLDNFIHQLMILTEFDTLIEENGFSEEQIELFIGLYSNLVESEIAWAVQKYSSKNKGLHKNHLNNCSIEEQINNQHIINQPPGIYINLLQNIAENAKTQQQLENIIYILKVILQNYEVPTREENVRMQADCQYLKTQNSQLFLGLFFAEAIQGVISSLFQNLIENQYEIGQLSNLYIQVVDKMLSYMLHIHQIPKILSLIIRNENKRIEKIESKSKYGLNSILSQTHEKQKMMTTQNIKKVLIKTKQLMIAFCEQKELESFKTQVNLVYSLQAIPKDLIDCIMTLWQENQIDYFQNQFLEFILTAVKNFPEYFILTQNQQRNLNFLELVGSIISDSYHLNFTQIFIEIVSITLHYIQNYDSDSKIQRKKSVLKYFVSYKDQWSKIIQHLEGLLYSQNIYKKQIPFSNNSNQQLNSQIHLKVENLYQTINIMLKSALQNMEVEI